MELTPVRRPTITLYEPTPTQLRAYRPVGKAAILAWYQKQKRVLEKRRTRAVSKEVEYFVYEVDLEQFMFNKREVIIGKKRAKKFILDLWKLSEQDYQVHSKHLEEMFRDKKREHNRQLKEQSNVS